MAGVQAEVLVSPSEVEIELNEPLPNESAAATPTP